MKNQRYNREKDYQYSRSFCQLKKHCSAFLPSLILFENLGQILLGL